MSRFEAAHYSDAKLLFTCCISRYFPRPPPTANLSFSQFSFKRIGDTLKRGQHGMTVQHSMRVSSTNRGKVRNISTDPCLLQFHTHGKCHRTQGWQQELVQTWR